MPNGHHTDIATGFDHAETGVMAVKAELGGAGQQAPELPSRQDVKNCLKAVKNHVFQDCHSTTDVIGRVFALSVVLMLLSEFMALAYGSAIMAQDLVPDVPLALTFTVFSTFMLLNAFNFALNKWMWGFWTAFYVYAGLRLLQESMLPVEWSNVTATLLVGAILGFHVLAGSVLSDMRE